MVVTFAELIGYIASFFVAISLLMSSFLALRVLNLIGAVAFVIYGAMLNSVPVMITNGFITVVDIVFLVKMIRPDLNGVQYISIGRERRAQLDDFIAAYRDDIIRFFPDFTDDRVEECFDSGGAVYLAMKDLSVVGFSLVHPVPDPDKTHDTDLREVYRYVKEQLFPERSAMIPVDYITKRYRGFGLVQRLYELIEQEWGANVSFLLGPVHRGARRHARFLEHHQYSISREIGPYLLYGKAL